MISKEEINEELEVLDELLPEMVSMRVRIAEMVYNSNKKYSFIKTVKKEAYQKFLEAKTELEEYQRLLISALGYMDRKED